MSGHHLPSSVGEGYWKLSLGHPRRDTLALLLCPPPFSQHPSTIDSGPTLKFHLALRTYSFIGGLWVVVLCGRRNMGWMSHVVSLWDFLCKHTCPFTCSKRPPWYRLFGRCKGLLSSVQEHPQGSFSHPFPLPLAIPAKNQPGSGSPCLSPR